MENEKLKIVIVGHVDHGKSTLIGRLLYDTNSIAQDKIEEIEKISGQTGQKFNFAYLLDHLQEEREQGVTIDTTQTFFSSKKKDYVIIDAPGHIEFIKNMVTGASQAEVAILIVDALEGCQEQTKRHAYILSLLGIKEIVVAINKMDLVDYKEETFNCIKIELTDFLNSINLKANSYIPVSALENDNIVKRSENMPWYSEATILEYLDGYSKPMSELGRTALLPIQDVYKIEKKRIAVGRLEAGTIKVGDYITIFPTNSKTKVKSIEKYLETTSESLAGECIGITTKDPVFLERGYIVSTNTSQLMVTNTFQASIFWISPETLRVGEKVKIQCATQETLMEITEIISKVNSSTLASINDNMDQVNPLEVCQVSIRTKKPITTSTFGELFMMGRIVILKNEIISGGGIITAME